MSDELKCWMCRRTFEEALKAFNEATQSDEEIGEKIKSRYIEGQKEFFPADYDRYVGFRMAAVEEGKYRVTGEILGHAHIWLCPVCSGLFESILDGVDEMIKDKVSKEDLMNVSISIKRAWNL